MSRRLLRRNLSICARASDFAVVLYYIEVIGGGEETCEGGDTTQRTCQLAVGISLESQQAWLFQVPTHQTIDLLPITGERGVMGRLLAGPGAAPKASKPKNGRRRNGARRVKHVAADTKKAQQYSAGQQHQHQQKQKGKNGRQSQKTRLGNWRRSGRFVVGGETGAGSYSRSGISRGISVCLVTAAAALALAGASTTGIGSARRRVFVCLSRHGR
ncbi:hypothetical protein MRB53_040000 [Persea americana]|nr:hypothetical protein MRB53_040000 [Persea americana]